MTSAARSAPSIRVTRSRIAYGQHPSQFGELTAPAGASRGVVVVIHGGFWRSSYGLELGRPLSTSLAQHGWTAWNIEYRRVGNGGGAGATCDDVDAALNRLAIIDAARTDVVVTLGHSAGGHLAVWSAGRHRYAAWSGALVRPTAAVSQAGVLDLQAAHRDGLGGGAVAAFLGHPPTSADAAYDPQQQLPAEVPVRCIHAVDDLEVPIGQSRGYVGAAHDAGQSDVSLTEVAGDHFVVIDPQSSAWQLQLAMLEQFAR